MNAPRAIYDGIADVQDILALKGKEEDLFLEVKRATVPMSQDDKENLAIALSGFANSAGGVLIFGLVAAKKGGDGADVIEKVAPLNDLDRFLPEVQSLIGKAVVPLVEGVEVKSVRYRTDHRRGFAVILVPESDRGPHRAMLKGTCRQYYKRSGDSFYVMEHFDLADMFGRRRRPELRFYWRVGHVSRHGSTPGERRFGFALIIGVENVGRGNARFPLFDIQEIVGASIFEYGVDGNRNHGLPIRRSDRWPNVTFAGGSNDVIHPGTKLDVTALGRFEVTELNPTMPDIKLKLTLAAEDLDASLKEIVIEGIQILNQIQIQ
jgi:hypothetical protein